jgi:integrase
MQKATYTKVYNLKKKLNTEGKATIQVRVSFNRKSIYFDTQIKVKPYEWDIKFLKIKNLPNAIELNNTIDKFIRDLQDIELRALALNKPFNLEILKTTLKNGNSDDFLKFFFDDLQNRHDISRETYRTQLATHSVLKYFKSSISFDSINISLLENFRNFLLGRDNKINTIEKHFRIFKTYVNRAIDKELVEYKKHPFKNFVVKSEKTKKEYLIDSEIRILENLEISNPSHKLTLDKFMFSVYTGIRFEDLNSFQIEYVKNPMSEDITLEFRQHKTSELIEIPLYAYTNKATQIVEYYLLNYAKKGLVFPKRSNQNTNRDLKEIMQIASINKSISFHCARHTFAIRMLHTGNIKVEQVKELMGHKKLETTMQYVQIIKSDLVNNLIKAKKGME